MGQVGLGCSPQSFSWPRRQSSMGITAPTITTRSGRLKSAVAKVHRVSPAGRRPQEKSMRKTLLAMNAAVAVAVTAVTAQAQQTIKIGLICPYSGQFADAAAQLDN